MTVDFPQGVPDECVTWLHKHVGSGVSCANGVSFDDCAWFYERRYEVSQEQAQAIKVTEGSYMPSITVRDPVKAMWFALRWSGV